MAAFGVPVDVVPSVGASDDRVDASTVDELERHARFAQEPCGFVVGVLAGHGFGLQDVGREFFGREFARVRGLGCIARTLASADMNHSR